MFVYGSLRHGRSLHGWLRRGGVRFLGVGRMRGRWYDLGAYPGGVESGSTVEWIEGELYALREPARQLPQLDALEEFFPEKPRRSLFVRQLREVRLLSGRKVQAWAYLLPRKPTDARLIRGEFLPVQYDSKK